MDSAYILEISDELLVEDVESEKITFRRVIVLPFAPQPNSYIIDCDNWEFDLSEYALYYDVLRNRFHAYNRSVFKTDEIDIYNEHKKDYIESKYKNKKYWDIENHE